MAKLHRARRAGLSSSKCKHGRNLSHCDECARVEKELQEKNLQSRLSDHRYHVAREKWHEQSEKEREEEAKKDPFSIYSRDVTRTPQLKVKGKVIAEDCALCRTPIYANQGMHHGSRKSVSYSGLDSGEHVDIIHENYHLDCCEVCAHCFNRAKKNIISREYRICSVCGKHICLFCSPIKCEVGK